MVLFNSFLNGRASGGAEYPTTAAQSNSSQAGGATLSQSVIGLKFQGPEVLGGGRLSGSMYLDTWGGTPSNSLNHLIRLRTATIEIDWKNTTIVAGQDKPIVSPREPNSLAQVADSPLTGAGNLWLWQPQIRIDQRFSFGQNAGLTAQVGVYQTAEPSYALAVATISRQAPLLGPESKAASSSGANSAKTRASRSPPASTKASPTPEASPLTPASAPSTGWSSPCRKSSSLACFSSVENAAGLGGLRQGFSIVNDQRAVPIGANGGWVQFSYLATKRLTFNIFGGEENDRAADLLSGDIHRNRMYGANAIYRLGSNVLIGMEVSQTRTNYFLLPSKLNNHYDLSLAYLF